MSFGFKFKETMRGNYFMLATPTDERAMSFTIEVKALGLRSFARDPVARIEGRASLEGFADDVALEGTLAFRLHGQQRLIYDFTFNDNDGRPHRFRGQKDLTPLAPVASVTTLPGTIYEGTTREVGRATLRFDLRSDFRRLARSLRLVRE